MSVEDAARHELSQQEAEMLVVNEHGDSAEKEISEEILTTDNKSPSVKESTSAWIIESGSDSHHDPSLETFKEHGIKDAQDDARIETPPERLEEPNHPSRPPISLLHEIAFVANVCAAQLLTQSGFAQAIVALRSIGKSFGVDNSGQLSWYAAAYSLTAGSFILIAGRVGDIYGHKLLFVLGFVWFGLWSLLAGISVFPESQIFFDICRAFQGIGPAMLLPNALAILGRTYPSGRRKQMVFSIFGGCAPSGFLLGAVFSSLLSERLWWPWAYWIMAIACCSCGISGSLLIPEAPDGKTKPKGASQFDYLGSITGIAGLVSFNIAWNQAPVVGWGTPYVIVLLILGLISILAFFLVERRVAQPLLPLDALSGKVGFVLGCIVLGWSSFGIWIFYIWQFWEVERGLSPLLATARTLPIGVSGLVAAITTGFLLGRMRTSSIMVIALCAFVIGNVLLATAPINQTYWGQTFVSLIIMCWGMDMSFPAATITLSDLVSHEHQGIAASLVNTLVNYSISIGLGIAGTVEVNVNRGGSNVLRGYRGAWYAAIGLSGLGVFLALSFAFVDSRFRRRPET
ncbi:Low affinity NH4+ transporter [Hypocenomyce scalaris]|nr:Low affinity NH4+ transporter [Hypocenomyce scalaris]